jgi:crotonobetainyl-CoA:carnitine CoA-transferase CaiB-like acyl-CoA transferase
LLLADLGAEVVKVEPPSGDPLRGYGGGVRTNAIAANVNRNKRSIALSLRDEADRTTFLALIERADVLLHNWRPAVERSLRLDEEVLRAVNPQLVTVVNTGFGPDGPRAEEPAFDQTIQAYAGLFVRQGGSGEPAPVRTYIGDKTASMFAVQAVLAALFARERSGRGDRIHIPMLDALSYAVFPDVFEYRTYLDDDGEPPVKDYPSTVCTLDGRMVLAPGSGQQIKATLEVVGHPEWKKQLVGISDRITLVGTILTLIEPVLQTRPSAYWVTRFTEVGVPAAPVLDIDGHLEDAQVRHNRVYGSCHHPRHGAMRTVRFPARFASWPGIEPSHCPDVDENGAEIRAELDVDTGVRSG